ncbi:MAG: fabG [Acidimicrobiia bacterium]|nr:fabG [Acidimicrobiia bacterium]
MRELDQRVAVVTGATRGIGRAIAARLSEAGARVVVNGRDARGCAEFATALGREALSVPGDIGEPEVAAQLVAAALDRWGRVDIAVNNAGVALDNYITGITDDRWDQTLATNLSGPLYLTRAVVPPMKAAGGGSILNVTSWAGIRGNVGQAAYSASKAGLYGLTLTCAKELGKFGIRVNALAPAVPTDIGAQMSPEMMAAAAKRRPLKIEGTVDDVAEGALFLLSDRARFITGQLLNIDGGIHLS